MAIRLTALQKHQREKFIQSSAIKGIGANETVQRLKDIGLPLRRTDALRKYREYAGIPVKEEVIKHVKKQAAIGRDMYTNQEGTMHRRYRYIVSYETYNKTSGVVQKYKTAVINDTELLPWQIEMEAEKGVSKGLDRSPFKLLELYVSEAHHRAGDTWQ